MTDYGSKGQSVALSIYQGEQKGYIGSTYGLGFKVSIIGGPVLRTLVFGMHIGVPQFLEPTRLHVLTHNPY